MKDIHLKILFDQILCPGIEWIMTAYILQITEGNFKTLFNCSTSQLLSRNLKIKTKTNKLGTFSKIHATPGHWKNSYLEISCTKQILDSLVSWCFNFYLLKWLLFSKVFHNSETAVFLHIFGDWQLPFETLISSRQAHVLLLW